MICDLDSSENGVAVLEAVGVASTVGDGFEAVEPMLLLLVAEVSMADAVAIVPDVADELESVELVF